jgi:hypothetical protein
MNNIKCTVSLFQWSGTVGIYKLMAAFDTSLVCSKASYVRYLSALSLSFKGIRTNVTDPSLSFRSWSPSQLYAEHTRTGRCSNYEFWRRWPVLLVTSIVLPEVCSACDRVFSLQCGWVSRNSFQDRHSTPFQIHYASPYQPTLYPTARARYDVGK